MISVSVPGKVMLSGEYAVLKGGRAVMLPLPRYLTLSDEPDRQSRKLPKVLQNALDYPIPEIVEYEKEHGLPQISLNDKDFWSVSIDGAKTKLGIGLSSAEAVAGVSFRFKRAGLESSDYRDVIAAYAREIHQQGQKAAGSGADVYCCCSKSPIMFWLEDYKPHFVQIENEKLNFPLPVHLLFTGRSFDSRKAVELFNGWVESSDVNKNQLVEQLLEQSKRLAECWFQSDSDILINAVDQSLEILKQITQEAGIEYWTGLHTEIDKWARKYGGRVKPVGAGGGDMMLILGRVPIDAITPEPYSPCFYLNDLI